MAHQSFAEILEGKMHSAPLEEAPRHQDLDPVGLAFLLGQVNRFHFSPPKSYPRTPPPKREAKPQIRNGIAHKLSESQLEAFAYFAETSTPLLPDFTLEELKKSFRKQVFTAHPDRGGSTAQFMALKKSYQNLLKVFIR